MALRNGKTWVGCNLDGHVCRLLVGRRQAGGAALLGLSQVDLDLAALDQDETRQAFLAAARPFLARHEAHGAPAYLALPGSAISLHSWPAPEKGGLLKSWGQPPLTDLTPLPAEQVAWAARAVAGQPGLRQLALAPAGLAHGLWNLMQEAGLKPMGLDLAASMAALAALRLAGSQRRGLCLRLDPAEAAWAWLVRGGIGQMGVLTALPGETALTLAQRAAQEAVNTGGPAQGAPILLWGPGAEALLQDRPGQAVTDNEALPLAPLPLPPLPAELEPQDQPLWLLLAQNGAAPSLFALHPQARAAGGWLESPGLTRRLAWGASAMVLGLLLAPALTQWWDYAQAQSALDQTRAQQQEFKRQRQNLRRDLGPQAALLEAQELRGQAPRLLTELASRLPAGAWLESLSCQGPACTLLVAGASRPDLQQALTQDAPWRLTAPLTEAGSRPGAGELLKVEITWEGGQGD